MLPPTQHLYLLIPLPGTLQTLQVLRSLDSWPPPFLHGSARVTWLEQSSLTPTLSHHPVYPSPCLLFFIAVMSLPDIFVTFIVYSPHCLPDSPTNAGIFKILFITLSLYLEQWLAYKKFPLNIYGKEGRSSHRGSVVNEPD